MFSWICPKCGREVPPSNSECPFCAPATPTPPAPVVQAPASGTAAMGALPTSTFQMAGMPMAPSPQQRQAAPVAPVVPQAAPQYQPPPPTPMAPPMVPAAPQMVEGGKLPNWLGALLAFVAVGIIAAAVAWYTTGRRAAADEDPALSAPARKAQTKPGTHPYERYLELTGFRITAESAKKLQLTFLVVNHGAAEMTNLGGIVELKAKGAGPDDLPACTFAFKVSSVPPFGAKEVVVNEFSQRRKAIDMPDWQFFEAKVEITSPD